MLTHRRREQIDIPEPRMEPLEMTEFAEAEALEPGMFQCVQCERIEKLDYLLKFQEMLGTCDNDECLEARVAELLAIENAAEVRALSVKELMRSQAATNDRDLEMWGPV